MTEAIDVHAHVGLADGFPQKGKEKELLFMPQDVLDEMRREAGVRMVMASAAEGIFPFGGHTVTEANRRLFKLTRTVPWLYQWVIVNPLAPETYTQAGEMLKEQKCVGIKIHPDAHGYSVAEYGNEIFAFASEFQAVVETHSGDRLSMPEEYVAFADRYPDVRILLSHLGNGCDGDVTHQVRAISESRNGNLYTDVSSAKSILPGLVEWAVHEVGSEHIMFGSDSPLHHLGMMRSRIDYGELSDQDKKNILYRTAKRLFSLN